MSKKIKITESQYELIVKNMINEKRELNEGIMDTLKYGISKIGRYKAGGKIFGKGEVDRQAAEKIKQIIDKKGNEIIKNLDATIKKENPEFPNTEDQKQFLSTVLEISAVYDSIIAATKKDPKDKTYIPVDVANGVITDLREYVKKFLDVDLKGIYTTVDESEVSEMDGCSEEQLRELDEEWGLNEDESDDVRSALQAKRGTGDDFDSQRMQTLKSNKLPAILAGAGASLGALGWMAQTDWLKTLIESWLNKPGTSGSDAVYSITKGYPDEKGFLHWAHQLDPSNQMKTGNDVMKFVNKFGAEDVSHMFDENGAGDSMGQVEKLRQLVGGENGAKSVGEIFKGPTFGDMKGGRNLFGVSKAASFVSKQLVKQAVKATAGSTAGTILATKIAAVGAVLAPLGIGALATGALVKLMRMKGQKTSRAATLNSLYQSLRNLEGGVIDQGADKGADKGGAKGGDGNVGANDELYNSLKNLFQFVVNNKNTLGSGAMGTNRGGNLGDRSYGGGQIMRGGDRAAAGGQTQSGRERFFSNQSNVRENEEMNLSEGKYIKDKRVLQYLSKSLPFEKVKNFENLIGRIEYLRNVLKKVGQTDDKTMNNFIAQLNKNPIMATDFTKLFNVDPNNQQQVNSLLGMVKEILSAVYSSDFKFGNNIVDKMSTLGGGNINKVAEEAGYNATDPNKSFSKDAQRPSNFKNNLVNFFKVLMSMFQYMTKMKSQKPKQQGQQAQQGQQQAQQQGGSQGAPASSQQSGFLGGLQQGVSSSQNEDESNNLNDFINENVKLKEEVERIKKIMLNS